MLIFTVLSVSLSTVFHQPDRFLSKMFDFLFGWRKASKCKNLIRKVQCRLKILKNKRSCIVKQLRGDVAQLLKHGHHQLAFDRVEQICKDESMMQLYDLLENYCEFVIINLPYIRKHKDCPNDISEAVSTLIFSSARFGELPELLSIRKLFGERFGQRFLTAALELRPGNLVNLQIKENLYIKNVPDDVKYRLLDEIRSICVEPGPLLLEYTPCSQEQKATNTRDVTTKIVNGSRKKQTFDATEAEENIVYVDMASESLKISKDPCNGLTKERISELVIQKSTPGEIDQVVKPAECTEINRFRICSHNSLQRRDSGASYGGSSQAEDYSSDTSTQSHEEMIYLDDIEEFVSPKHKDGNLQDQRLFLFKSFGIPLKEITHYRNHNDAVLFQEENSVSRNSRKMRNTSRKRLRKRSLSQENRYASDVKCAIYYGELDELPPDTKHKFDNQRQVRHNNLEQESRKPYRFAQGNGNVKVDSSFSLTESRNEILGFSCTQKTKELKDKLHSPEPQKVHHTLRLFERSYGDDPVGEEETRLPYLRTMTMPVERSNESPSDNIFRSHSFPFEQPRSCLHIHPKLPDYDELEAKFLALKKANLRKKE